MSKPTAASTALIMRIIGWGFVPAVLAMLVLYPHGFAWGIEEGSQYHPYLWMMLTLYITWCYLLVREAKDPTNAGLLFDFGIIANTLHAVLMVGQAIMMWENEVPHMWADIPILFALVYILWKFHPKRLHGESTIRK
jgi:hypothetical protein